MPEMHFDFHQHASDIFLGNSRYVCALPFSGSWGMFLDKEIKFGL